MSGTKTYFIRRAEIYAMIMRQPGLNWSGGAAVRKMIRRAVAHCEHTTRGKIRYSRAERTVDEDLINCPIYKILPKFWRYSEADLSEIIRCIPFRCPSPKCMSEFPPWDWKYKGIFKCYKELSEGREIFCLYCRTEEDQRDHWRKEHERDEARRALWSTKTRRKYTNDPELYRNPRPEHCYGVGKTQVTYYGAGQWLGFQKSTLASWRRDGRGPENQHSVEQWKEWLLYSGDPRIFKIGREDLLAVRNQLLRDEVESTELIVKQILGLAKEKEDHDEHRRTPTEPPRRSL